MNVFFFKQKTAYEMLRSLVGSEMCIRDRCKDNIHKVFQYMQTSRTQSSSWAGLQSDLGLCHPITCLLYTSDAADEEDSVDLGGRRIIKKKRRIRGMVQVVREQ
eukprot:TRINITY_DN36651_c0_g1_i1.p1 TRINITY_DN36651_c0_g1~~TRINITY_DN36651_c0_g1_i1.p1  ORF type:complete len:104 (+),score=40.78 TRINITY_DN36651_c0_g1_i1:109-420(+)